MRKMFKCASIVATAVGLFVLGSRAAPPPSTSPAERPPIHPPPAVRDSLTLNLDAKVTNVVPAGAGRYLLLQMESARRLAVFDANEGKVVKTVPLPGEKCVIAGGKTKFIVGDPTAKTLERWDLGTFAPDLKAAVPKGALARDEMEQDVHSLAMGYATDGPVLVHGRVLVDGNLKPLPVDVTDYKGYSQEVRYAYRVDASADGTTFGGTQERGLSPSGVDVLRVGGPKAAWQHEHSSAPTVIPTYDGSLVCGKDVVKPVFKPSQEFERVPGLTFNETKGVFVPAYSRDFLIRVGIEPLAASIVFIRDPKHTPMPVPWKDGVRDPWVDGLIYTRRVHYIPDAQLFVGVNDSLDKLSLVHFDAFDAMKKAGINYVPPPAAEDRTR